MKSILINKNTEEIKIIYDGQCILCSNYVSMVQLKKNIKTIELIDARIHKEYVTEMTKRGLDINQGMLVIYGDKLFFGSEAVHILAILSSKSNLILNFINVFFSSKIIASIIYPFCKFGRNLILKINGRKMIKTDLLQ